MDAGEARRRLATARVGRLATADAGAVPHVVPFVFVLEGDTIYWAVDEKPKRTRDLKRVANIKANPNVEIVVDQYEEDWARLWAGPGRGGAK
jgi:PPOX class probable F420-dependent enzyme